MQHDPSDESAGQAFKIEEKIIHVISCCRRRVAACRFEQKKRSEGLV